MRAFLVIASLTLLAGCIEDTTPPPQDQIGVQSTIPPYPPEPALPTEDVPLPPVSGQPLIWQPGHWNWTGRTYVYKGGRWVIRSGHGTMWQDGYWTREDNQWVWIPAHWV